MYVCIDICIYRQTYLPIYHKMYMWHEQIYVYIHIHIYTYTHTYIYIYICMYMQTYVNINKATYPYMITCIYIYIYTHTCIGMFTYNVCAEGTNFLKHFVRNCKNC